MNDLNRWTGIGRVGKDPEVRYMPDGTAVVNLSVACGQSWKDKQTGEKKERVEWIPLVFMAKLAEIVGQYVKKGDQIYVEGEFRTRKWEKDGETRYTTEIRVENMKMLGGKRDGDSQGNRGASSEDYAKASGRSSAGRAPPPADHGGFDDDDIPFS